MFQPIKNIRDQIILILEECEEVQGTNKLALRLGLGNNKTYIIKSARRLAENEQITILHTCGGRGHKTVYKRNRNQPGLARKTR